ncbi:MAG: hypothetical protein A2X86_08970 [Bdellovibrionales bacterium GWA2_49_15]|nr:MAG: hypothetical protein A2X86_08970 [Bdellovibrionales bacterium GWA2_49_15]
MKFEISPSHVAVLVPSVQKAADYLRQFDYQIGEEEVFEETREIYVQGSRRNSLLLMEAKETGSYQRALKKRGPGIHHLAIDVLNIEKFLSSLSGSGWLLHLYSLKSIKDSKTAYLARPGFPALIEVQEKKKLSDGPLFVDGITLKFDSSLASLVKSVGLDEIVKPSKVNSGLTIQGRSIELSSLF